MCNYATARSTANKYAVNVRKTRYLIRSAQTNGQRETRIGARPMKIGLRKVNRTKNIIQRVTAVNVFNFKNFVFNQNIQIIISTTSIAEEGVDI